MTNPAEGQHAPTGDEVPPNPLRPPTPAAFQASPPPAPAPYEQPGGGIPAVPVPQAATTYVPAPPAAPAYAPVPQVAPAYPSAQPAPPQTAPVQPAPVHPSPQPAHPGYAQSSPASAAPPPPAPAQSAPPNAVQPNAAQVAYAPVDPAGTYANHAYAPTATASYGTTPQAPPALQASAVAQTAQPTLAPQPAQAPQPAPQPAQTPDAYQPPAGYQPAVAPQPQSATHQAPTPSPTAESRGLSGSTATTNEHVGPVPANHDFIEPGRHSSPQSPNELQPTAPHLDPRIAHLTNVEAPKKRLFGRTHKTELPTNATSDALTRPIQLPRRISVVGLKGGVGKTTSSILLARSIARSRPDPVLLLDSDTTYGSLLLRLGVPPIASAHDIAAMGDPGALQVLNGMIARTDDGVWVVPSGRNPAQSAAFSEQVYVSAVRALYRYFPVSITDCGTGIAGPLMKRVVDASHALVIATSASVDGVLSAHNALQWLQSTGQHEIASRAIVVIGNVSEQPKIDVAETKRGLEAICRSVICIPSDTAVAPGGFLNYDELSPETRQAGIDLAAVALESAFQGGS